MLFWFEKYENFNKYNIIQKLSFIIEVIITNEVKIVSNT
jgi:hypothetical protein